MSHSLAQGLLETIAREAPRLRAITDQDAQTRPGGSDGWSRKQEIGHLLDSATNNRVRFIAAALEGRYSGPTYDGVGWVEIGGYAHAPWTDLIDLWESANHALATAVSNIPEKQLSAPCRIGAHETVSLHFLIEDYILHMQHHLDHILARAQMTAYPGASSV